MDYKTAGVDIEKANTLTNIIKKTVVSENIGMFAGIYDHPYIPEYSFAACTDGVGTKIIPLIERDLIETIAIDLAAMNLNDLICTGASPLFFLDYFATNSLNIDLTSRFIKALKETLEKYNCTLLGGETSELRDLITKNYFDIGGFAVGIVKKDNLLRKENVEENDIVIGLKSSGPHSNGFTLIRKLREQNLLSDKDMAELIKPTYIYVNEILKLCQHNLLKACAHITGGGIVENLARIIPQGLCAEVFKEKIPILSIFDNISSIVGEKEAYKTFNMGVGMCLITSPDNINKVIDICKDFDPFIFGRIIKDEKGCSVWLR